MNSLLDNLEIKVNEHTFIKNPKSSDLGRRIITGAVDLMAEIGFEEFTFKKLGQHIQSPEASIYRYFESKHKLLLYITAWYWNWIQYQLVFSISNLSDAETQLMKAVEVLTCDQDSAPSAGGFNMHNLQTVVIENASKGYLTKQVDEENSYGVFLGYKEVVRIAADLISRLNPDYQYPHMLISTVVEGAKHQRYFAEHLPRLTNVVEGKDAVTEFYQQLVMKAIQA